MNQYLRLSLGAGILGGLLSCPLLALSADAQATLVRLINGLETKAAELGAHDRLHPELKLAPIVNSLNARIDQLKKAKYQEGSNLFSDAAAYVGVSQTMAVTPNFFGTMYSDTDRQAILLHEGVHLGQNLWETKLKFWGTRGEAEAYREEYKWLVVLGAGPEGAGSGYEIHNVVQALVENGVIPGEDKLPQLNRELGLTVEQLKFFNGEKPPKRKREDAPPARPPAVSPERYEQVTKWGRKWPQQEGHANGAFHRPAGVAVAPDGNILVTDTILGGGDNARAIQKFTPTGDFIAAWAPGILRPGASLWNATGITTDEDGNIYVTNTDSGDNRSQSAVYRFTPQGNYVRKWGRCDTAIAPYGVAHHKGRIYLQLPTHVEIYDPEGTPLNEWKFPMLDGRNYGFSIAVGDDGVLNIAVASGHVRQYNLAGALLRSWSENGPAPGQLNYARGIAVDRRMNVYVADSGNKRAQKFSPSGILISVFGEGVLRNPIALAVDKNENVYVLDRESCEIFRFDRKR